MTLHQLVGKAERLRRELEALYGEPVWHTPAIDRVSNDLTETQIALVQRYAGQVHTPVIETRKS